jgi:hypothetical protein
MPMLTVPKRHQAIVRCIFAYFMEIPQEKSPWMEVPLHTLMKLTPKAYGTEVERFKADIPAVSTWRPKGSTAKHHDSMSDGVRDSTAGDAKAAQKSVANDKDKLNVPGAAM